jgi:uncharacterized membrane protein
MEHIKNTNPVKPLSSRSTLLFIAAIIGLQLLIALLAYPFLPPIVPTHWDAAGQINGYGPKWVDTFLFPAMTLGIFILIRVLLSISPRMVYGREGQRANVEIVDRLLIGVFLVLLVVQLTALAASFHLPVDMSFIISLVLSAMILYIGNYLGKLRRNFWAGIRTPWTLLSDTVWERTHRFTGWLFVGTGAVGIALSFVPSIRIWGIVSLLLLDIVLAFVYSYVIYQRLEAEGQNPVSPPFDGGA